MNVMLNRVEFTPAQSAKTYSEMTVAELFAEQKRLFRIAAKEKNKDISDAATDLGCNLFDLIAEKNAHSKKDVRAKLLMMLEFYTYYLNEEVTHSDFLFFSALRTTLEFLKEA